MVEPTRLRTERLLLRPLELEDAADIQRLAGDRAIADTTLHIPHPYEDGVAEKFIAEVRAKCETGEFCSFAITLAESGELLGGIGLVVSKPNRRAELGYWIGHPYWRRGYGTEAARAVVDHGFRALSLNRIEAGHFARNPASGRILQKIGMIREGVQREYSIKWGLFEDMVQYGVLRGEWPGLDD